MVETILDFEKRDFLYDNGLVNIFLTLLQDSRFDKVSKYKIKYKNSKVQLDDLKLQFAGDFEEIKEIYFILRSIYYSKVFEETNNNKPYYDPEKDKIVIKPVLNVKPFLQRSERTKDLLPKRTVSDTKLEELKIEEENVKKDFDGKISGKLQYGKKSQVNLYLSPEKLGENISGRIKEFINKNECVFCGSKYTGYKDSNGKKKWFSIVSTNLIFDFGTGDPKPSFRDSRTKNDISICFMCDIIYRYGLLKNYFVDKNVFLISSPSLRFSLNIKMKIPNINNMDEYLPVENNSKTNFLNKGEFAATGINSRLLALLYKLYSKILSKDEFNVISLFYFIVTSRSIDDLRIYNKMAYISLLFDETRNIIIKPSGQLFLHKLINYAFYKNISTFETKNMPREQLCYEILNGMPIDSTIFDLSYYNLSEDGSGLKPDLLYEFLEKYLEVIKMVDLKELHEICRIIGDRIGYFAANTNKKTLLYQLREIGNLEGLIGFFKDLEYEILKENAGATWNSKPIGKEENYSNFINKLLINVQNNKDASFAKNYLGIYAVQKYLSTKYAKSQGSD
jgi:hypothetical protein